MAWTLALTLVGAAGLGAVGGMSYAASVAKTVVEGAARHVGALSSPPSAAKRAARPPAADPANDQYGTTSTTSSTTTATTTTTSPGPTTTAQTTTQGVTTEITPTLVVQTITPTSSGGITGPIVPTNPGEPPAPTFAVNWQADTFANIASTTGSAAVTVKIDASPPTAVPIVGSASALIQLTVTDSNGNQVHALAAPLDVKFTAPEGHPFPTDYVPVISTDGSSWRSTTLLAGTTLADDQQDGYYTVKNAAGDIVEIHILTRHLTVFAVLYKGNVTISESGRKVPQAGSGLFGDPTRNHPGAPALKSTGTVRPIVDRRGAFVPVKFFLDEQADLRVSLYDAKGKQLLLDETGTRFRGQRLTGEKTRSLHLLVLRPGTMVLTLKGALRHELAKGKAYQVRLAAIDFDGNKTVRLVSFRG